MNSMLEGLNQTQLYDIVAKMKGMIQQNPEQARQVLITNPALTYSLLQAQALLGMINVQTVNVYYIVYI
jgi:cleavage stimulation factor subunit 2